MMGMANSSKHRDLVLFGALLLLSGCQPLAVWMTRAAPASAVKATSPRATSELPAEVDLEAATKAKANAEILQEIYRVVLVQNPRSPADFGNWVDSLNQGASLEGVYAGFTRSQFQRSREKDNKTTASPRATRAFAVRLARLLLEFPEVPELADSDAQPMAEMVIGTEGAPDRASEMKLAATEQAFKPFVKAIETPRSKIEFDVLANRLTVQFSGASIFTQKRVLGEWGLRVIQLRRDESAERLRDWYADFAAAMASEKVDFGLDQRNDASREFHRKWADRASDDQIRWEVLNRLHRVLNQAQGLSPQN